MVRPLELNEIIIIKFIQVFLSRHLEERVMILVCIVKSGMQFCDKTSVTQLGHMQNEYSTNYYFQFYLICPEAVAQKKTKLNIE